MVKPLSHDAQSSLISNFKQAVKRRVAAEEQLEARFGDASLAKAEEFRQALLHMQGEFEEQSRQMRNEFENQCAHVSEEFDAKTRAVQQEFDQKKNEVKRYFTDEMNASKEQHEEAEWMVKSMFDDQSDDSPKLKFDQFKAQLEKGVEQFKSEKETLDKLLQQGRDLLDKWKIGYSEEAQPTPGLTAGDQNEARELFTKNFNQIDQSLTKLKKKVFPSFISGVKIVFIAILLMVAMVALIGFVITPEMIGLDPEQVGKNWLAYSAGAGASIAGLFSGLLYMICIGGVKKQFSQMQESEMNCKFAHTAWNKYSKQELEKQKKEYNRLYGAIEKKRQNSLKQLAQKHEDQLNQLEQDQESQLTGLDQTYPKKLSLIEEQKQEKTNAIGAEYQANLKQVTDAYKEKRSQVEQQQSEYNQQQQQAEQEARQAMTTDWQQSLEDLHNGVTEMQEQSEEETPDWSDMIAPSWELPKAIPRGIRLGNMKFDMEEIPNAIPFEQNLIPKQSEYDLPLILPFPNDASMLIKTGVEGRDRSSILLQVALLRLLSSLPPGKVRLTILDPMGLGEDFSSFMHLADYDELMINNRIWTEPGQIDARLAEQTEHMENVFQAYLRNEYETIEDYNHHAGEVAEPYHIVVAANFPYNFNDTASKRLLSIASSGPRCGVYTLISVDTKQKLPHGFDMEELEKCSTTLTWKKGKYELQYPQLNELELTYQEPPEPQLFGKIVRNIGHLSKDARRVEVSFERVAPGPGQIWTENSQSGVSVPLGRAGATKLQNISLGKGTSQHVLIAGKTGSGKSTFLHILITNLALHYSPDQMELYLIDFKKGVEFKTYAAHDLPHARVIAIESDREFGVSVLERLDEMLKTRGDLFRQHNVQDLAGFRKACPEVAMPRVMLIVDEFQEYFVEDDALAQNATLLLDRLVRQGRAFGMHVLLGSQTLGGAYSLARSTLGQVAVRIALQCSEADAHLILSEDNTAARLLTRPGEAIYNDANGLLEGNHPFQIAWLGDDLRDKYLAIIAEKTKEEQLNVSPPIVFEGNIASDPARNETITEMVETRAQQPQAAIPRALQLWLGEAVAITDPSVCEFRKQSGNHLLMVGAQPESARGILATGLITLSAQLPLELPEEDFGTESPESDLDSGQSATARFAASLNLDSEPKKPMDPDLEAEFAEFENDDNEEDDWVSPFKGDSPFSLSSDSGSSDSSTSASTTPTKSAATFYILDGEYEDAPEETGWDNVAPVLPQSTRIGGVDIAPECLEEIAAHVNFRNESPNKNAPPIFLMIYHLGRFRELRKAEDDFSFGGGAKGPAGPADHLTTIIKDGPAVGVHALIWCDTYSNATRWLSSQLLREMETRIAFDMNATDSSNFIDTPAASRLGSHRAYLYMEDQGTLDKFRPYGLPSHEWLNWAGSQLNPGYIPLVIEQEQEPEPEPEPVAETVSEPTEEITAGSEPVIEESSESTSEPIEAAPIQTESATADQPEAPQEETAVSETSAQEEIAEPANSMLDDPDPKAGSIFDDEFEIPEMDDEEDSSKKKKAQSEDDDFDPLDDIDLWSIS